jgi:hypothetical protein
VGLEVIANCGVDEAQLVTKKLPLTVTFTNLEPLSLESVLLPREWWIIERKEHETSADGTFPPGGLRCRRWFGERRQNALGFPCKLVLISLPPLDAVRVRYWSLFLGKVCHAKLLDVDRFCCGHRIVHRLGCCRANENWIAEASPADVTALPASANDAALAADDAALAADDAALAANDAALAANDATLAADDAALPADDAALAANDAALPASADDAALAVPAGPKVSTMMSLFSNHALA